MTGNETFEKRVANLLTGKDKDKQAEAAFLIANSEIGYDTAIYFIPQGFIKEAKALLKKGKQVDCINKNRGLIAKTGTDLHLLITTVKLNTLALCSLIDMKQWKQTEGTALPLIRQEEYFTETNKLFHVNEAGEIEFKKDLTKEATEALATYTKTVATIKAVAKTVRDVAAWEHFGQFVTPDLLRNLDIMDEGLKELADVTAEYIETLAHCNGQKFEHFGRWGDGFPLPEAIEPNKGTLKVWQKVLNDIAV